MADNTQLDAGTGGDLIRTVAKTANSPAKTQVVVLDVGGGADGSTETAWTGSVSLTGTLPGFAATPTFTIGNASLAVTGSFFQATQPVSLVSVPTHAVTQSGGPWTVSWTGQTVAATQSGAWTITGISGTISLPTGAATSANQPTAAALGSTTSGQTGNLALGAVTTGAPAYTTGQTNALSLTATGALRVDPSAVTQPVSLASVPTHAVTQSSGPWTVSWTAQSVTVSNFPATQAISAAALPLPAGAALEAGNLATLATAAGAPADAAYSGSGSTGIIAALKGVYAALKAALTVSKSVGAAALTINQVAITSTATLIVAARTGAPGTGRVTALIYNSGGATVWLGSSSGVTSANGMPLLAGASISWDTTSAIYGIAASSGTVAYSETF